MELTNSNQCLKNKTYCEPHSELFNHITTVMLFLVSFISFFANHLHHQLKLIIAIKLNSSIIRSTNIF
uniref:Uncharacterized protein n=1 Tax=Kalanchoe fedtschenkoi TaxID=63787 RepID=A0A7N0RBW6_KALFE